MKLIEAVGKRIEVLLNEKGITQYELAKQAGMPRSTVWKIINTDTTVVKTVKLDTLYGICATLGISLEEFFSDPIFNDIED